MQKGYIFASTNKRIKNNLKQKNDENDKKFNGKRNH